MFMLDSQDPEVVYDLRDVNPGRSEQFWAEERALLKNHFLLLILVDMELCVTWPLHSLCEIYETKWFKEILT